MRYRITPDSTDYVVVKPREGSNVLRFAPKQRSAELILAWNQVLATRGQGNRTIDVTFEPGTQFKTGRRTNLKILVPDPKAVLSWAVEPATTLDRREPSKAQLRATVRPARSDTVTLRYRATPDPGLVFDGPPANTEGIHALTIEPGSTTSAVQTFQFRRDDLVGGIIQKLHLETADVSPPDLNDPANLQAIDIRLADDRPLSGQALVLVVLNDELVRNGTALLNELKAMEESSRNQLVGGSLYILASDKQIYRMHPTGDPFRDRRPFPTDADYGMILNAARDRVSSLFAGRARDRSLTVLIWQDSTERVRVPAGDKFAGFEDNTWHLSWIRAPPERSKLAFILEEVFRAREAYRGFTD